MSILENKVLEYNELIDRANTHKKLGNDLLASWMLSNANDLYKKYICNYVLDCMESERGW